MYYYGARYYDPRLSIFVSVDPLAEQFMGWTPYHYVHQNPINLIDPTGMSAELYDDPPEEGDFKNGDTHTDSSGSWTYQNRVWYDNTGNDNNILAPIVIGDEKISVGTQIVDSILSEINSFFDAIAADNKRMLSKVSSGPYGPLSGVGSGFSLNFNVFGNTLGFSMATEHYKGWGGTNFYTSYSGGHDAGFWKGIKQNTSLGKFISISGTFDTYHNNGFIGSFDKGVEGYTNDVFSGYGIMGSYSRPFDPGLNRVNPESGLYKTSIGISSPSPSIGLSRTKTIKLF